MRQILFISLGIVFVCYGLFVFAARSGTGFWLVWVAMGALCFLAAVLLHTGFFARHRAIGITAAAISIAALLLVGFLSARIITAFTAKAETGLDYLLVLGTQVRESGPSALLKSRLDTAAAYLLTNENTVCVVSGGKGDNEPVAEADAMYEYLVKCGIEESRILREDRSKNTAENIRFSRELLPADPGRVGVVTNDFHVFRAQRLARAGGFPDAVGISAPSVPAYLPNNIFRECLAIVKEWATGRIQIG